MKAKEHYNVAMYLRLSKDDGDFGGGKTESDSIGSQRDLIRSYIRSHKEMELFDIYSDDGYSGANFDRPQFKRMMKDVEEGNVDCIIVKDLSRFGRDYIEVGRLIQKTFPAFCVRFIAITDNFDSLTADHNETSLVLPIKNFVNDSYCRDISQKVKSQKKMKREKGEYVGAFVVYGYRKDPKNKNRIIRDDYAAEVVKQIFAWRIQGMSMPTIAKKLDERGILPPMEYKKCRGENFSTGFSKGGKMSWSAVAVRRILVNEMYAGIMVQGKTETINYKEKKAATRPKEEWVRVSGTHEAIISKEDFEFVQKLAFIDCKPSGKREKGHIFTGLLYCGDCGGLMFRRVNRYKGKESVSFICGSYNKRQGCTRHTTKEEDLKAVVLDAIQSQVRLFLDRETVLNRLNQMEIGFDEVVRFDKEIKRLYEEQEKYGSLRSALYEDLKRGILTEEDFKNFKEIYEGRYQEIQKSIEKQEQAVKDLFKSKVESGARLERFKEVMAVTECSREVLVAFVERIDIYEGNRMEITLKHKELFQKAAMLEEYVCDRMSRKERGVR